MGRPKTQQQTVAASALLKIVLREPWPCSQVARSALQPWTWCSGSLEEPIVQNSLVQ